MTKYKIIVNPISGRGTAAEAVPDLDRFLRERNMDFDLVLTERPEHAVELAKQAALDGFDIVGLQVWKRGSGCWWRISEPAWMWGW